MFKSLELCGFKSFADKTRFEFSDGVTVVVGPNGSGKSNVVDSIKWVLGEQKVKSLRGQEMTDVIFNGAAGRKPLNAAEVTLTFDNSDHRFPVDSAEVQITRRVQRSGEGEYLINRQSSRLKDIKELLAGTGIGTQAYCIIEQGKVDALLQSSPKDRRLIFEEASGISRFNGRKLEAQRRLEQANTNITRLADKVAEAEARLRTLKHQAGRAAKFRELSKRLQELRTKAGVIEWHALTKKIDSFDEHVLQLQNLSEQYQQQLDSVELEISGLDESIAAIESEILNRDSFYGEVRESIVSGQTNVSNQLRRLDEIQRQQSRYRQQRARLAVRAAEQLSHRRGLELEYTDANSQREDIAGELSESQTQLAQIQRQAEENRQQRTDCQNAALEKTRQVASLASEITSLQRQLEAKEEHRRTDQQRFEDIKGELDESARQRDLLKQKCSQLKQDRETLEEKVQELRLQLDDIGEQIQQRKDVVIEKLRMRRTGLIERIAILEELQQRRDELNPGLKEVLQRSEKEPEGPWGAIIGLAADLFLVEVEAAWLIELALGPMAEYLVVGSRGSELIQYLKNNELVLPGRVGLVWLEGHALPAGATVNLEGVKGIVGRADQFIQTQPEYETLARRLLGDTWIVETLTDAFTLSSTILEPLNFITLSGERLGADGTLCIGQRQAKAGSIARRSECHAKREELTALEAQIAQHWDQVKQMAEVSNKREVVLRQAENLLRKSRQKASEAMSELTAMEERFLQTQRRQEEIVKAMDQALEDRKKMEASLQKATDERQVQQQEWSELEARGEALHLEADRLDEIRRQLQKEATARQVSLGKQEQRCQGIQDAMEQDDLSIGECDADLVQCNLHLTEQVQAELQVNMAILGEQSTLAQLYLNKEELANQTWQLRHQRLELQSHRTTISKTQSSVMRDFQEVEKQLHDAERSKLDWEHQRTTLVQKLKEDYDLEIDKLASNPHRVAEIMADEQNNTATDGSSAGSSSAGNTDSVASEENSNAGKTGNFGENGNIDNTDKNGNTGENGNTDKSGNGSNGSATGAMVSLEAGGPAVLPELPDTVPAEITTEIKALRQRISALGSVNMEALTELDVQERSFLELSGQYKDITDSIHLLTKVIEKMNAESRRLFTETVENVRSRFSSLFSDLFGGGRAEIILEEGADVLEGGVEIVAQPPGKELSHISLLSGGEKTLTCVALLLAMFEANPSPFCVLDEVDAALDEANTDRFCKVLKRFQDLTQFIAISHSKRTMSVADTIYGITMQESGVSRQLSVRFEDVTEEGDIIIQDRPAA